MSGNRGFGLILAAIAAKDDFGDVCEVTTFWRALAARVCSAEGCGAADGGTWDRAHVLLVAAIAVVLLGGRVVDDCVWAVGIGAEAIGSIVVASHVAD